mgnify:CR=1 FL=1
MSGTEQENIIKPVGQNDEGNKQHLYVIDQPGNPHSFNVSHSYPHNHHGPHRYPNYPHGPYRNPNAPHGNFNAPHGNPHYPHGNPHGINVPHRNPHGFILNFHGPHQNFHGPHTNSHPQSAFVHSNVKLGEINISVEEAPAIEALTVKQAFDSAVDTEVIVKGIVAGSAVNQKGYYLIDETGAIVVKTSEDIGSLYSIGDEVIIKGTRAKHSKGNQSYIADGELLVNNRGNHSIPTNSFITGKTATDLFKTSTAEDHSGEVYTVEAQVSKVSTQYYTNYFATDDPTGTEGLQFYAANGGQYAWLDEFVDRGTFKMNIALCSWSGGTKGCLISIEDSEGTVYYNELYFK